MLLRDDILEFARSLVDTPFHHAARVPGVGIDCVGLIVLTGARVGSWPSGFDVLPYPEVPKGMYMRTVCRQHLVKKSYSSMIAGDIVLVISDESPQHVGIVGNYKDTQELSVIHASSIATPPRVVEHPLVFSRRFRFVEAYSFPGVV